MVIPIQPRAARPMPGGMTLLFCTNHYNLCTKHYKSVVSHKCLTCRFFEGIDR